MASLILALVCALSAPAGAVPAAAASSAAPDLLVASAALVMDLENGRTLFAKNPDRRMYPASTTKVMTAILAIEHGRLDEKVTIQRSDVQVQPSILGLVPGERIALRDLVYGLLLMSGNDAARAIARHVGGSETQFASLMNAKALQIGCTATQFVNPHGLPNPEHYTTARDLGRIMRYAMMNAEFRKITGARRYTSVSSHATRTFRNKNRLLRLYQGTTGGKPGYTRAAQQTLVASARRSDRELVVVCLHSRGRALWSDAMRLLDLGFRRMPPVAAGSLPPTKVAAQGQ